VLVRRMRKRDEKGFVVVWFALLMVLFMGMAAFAVDLGNWYLNIQRIQRSADAAALDGDILLPSDVVLARETARDGLIRNGIPASAAQQAFAVDTCTPTSQYCIAQVPNQTNQLEVHITTTVKNTFVKMFGGAKTTTFTRRAIAEHRTGLSLGSGRNFVGGNEPTWSGTPRWGAVDPLNTKYWPEVGGRDSAKQNGDRTTTDSCYDVQQAAVATVYGDEQTPTCASGNPEYKSTGRWFRVHVNGDPSQGNKYLIVQAYDPGFYVTTMSSTPCQAPYSNGVPRTTVDSCPGDGPSDGNPTKFTTTFRMRPALNDTSTTLGTCHAPFEGSENAGADMGNNAIGPYVHQWVTLCTPYRIDVSKSRDYFLQVTTGAGNGQNSFALRAGLSSTSSESNVDPALSQSLITISADNNIAMNYSLPTAGVPSVFTLSQVSNQWANQPITFEFFDLGDGGIGNGDGDFTMLDQSGNPVPGTCKYSVTPRAPAFVNAPGCSFHYTQALFNGQLVKFTWTPPANYSCVPTNLTSTGGCWIYGRLNAIDASPDDLTTWSLDYPDKPLRLVK
jgi:Flp pilus assembly protein TadG